MHESIRQLARWFARWERRLIVAYLAGLTLLVVASALVLLWPSASAWFYGWADERVAARRDAEVRAVATALAEAEAQAARGQRVEAAAVFSATATGLARRGAAWDRLRVAAWEGLARTEQARGHLPGLLRARQELVRFQPGLASRHADLGVALLETGLTVEGARALREALRLDPNCLPAVGALVAHLLARGRDREGLAVFSGYEQAYCMAQAGVRSGKVAGLRLWSGGRLLRAWRCAPRVDGVAREQVFALGEVPPSAPISALTLELRVGPACGEVQLLEARFLPVGGGPPLLDAKRLTLAETRGLGPGGRPTADTIGLAWKTPPVAAGRVDRIALRLRLRKRVPAALATAVARAKKRLEAKGGG